MSETESTSRASGHKSRHNDAESPRAVTTHEKALPVERLREAVALAAGVTTYEPNTETADTHRTYSRLELAHITAAALPDADLLDLVRLDAKAPMIERLAAATDTDVAGSRATRPLLEAVAGLDTIDLDVTPYRPQRGATEGDR